MMLHPNQLAALEALRSGSLDNVIYCDPCDGLRVKDHICYCWQCQAPVKTAPNPACHICQLIRKHFFADPPSGT